MILERIKQENIDIRNEGIKTGIKTGIKRTAKKMKIKNIDIVLIEEVTGLTEKEIKAL